jgi:phosphatidylserine/phosphatidylglycerophosphate/cardiolipin synthase-like enzyme
MKRLALILLLLAAVTAGCAFLPGGAGLTPNTLPQVASAWPLQIREGRVYTDNDAAFLSKLQMIRGARTSIDLSYYIFTDDESSSVLIKELLAAARRGVTVRLIVDYATNYNDLDLLSMMEAEGNGKLQVRLYGRPTANIVKDAVFMTMGCSKQAAPSSPTACSAEKFAAIDKLFADEKIGGVPTAGRNISNLNVGNSGLFLSGLYAKRGDVVALAAQKGQGIDVQQLKGQGATTSPEEKERLKKVGKDYLESRTGAPFQRLQANAALFFAFAVYGQQLNPLKETVTSLLPVDRTFSNDEAQDWDHFTDYTHHKFLLVDRTAVQLGGRNVENSYHMHPDPLIKKYVFMDTDLAASLTQGGDLVAQAFENIWSFSAMVATLDEVRQHAPNDFVVNLRYAERTCASQKAKPAQDKCMATEMQTHVHDLAQRMTDAKATVEANARTYETKYTPTPAAQASPNFDLDKGSLLAYLENLPFDTQLPPEKRQRTYGAPSDPKKVAQSDKHIHDAWLRALPGVCTAATRDNPKRIILHNAYFLPPANLTYAFSRLVDGTYDCSNVTVTVLTNSIDTTDLNVVNLFARHVLKAFTEFYQQHSDPAKRATFDYYEYQRPAKGPSPSLHTKVSVFGDDIIVGSANADVRSFMMDSNNAMLVRNAPEFTRAYLAYVQGILTDPARSKKLNDYFATTPRALMVQEDLAVFRQIMAKEAGDKVTAEEKKKLETTFAQMLDDAYGLTRDSMSPDLPASKQRENQNKFNEQFKPL